MTRTPNPSPAPPLLDRALRPFQRFFAAEAAGGLVLLGCTAIALAWANSPWAESYHHLWSAPVSPALRAWSLPATLHGWVNDGLMTVFFLVVGLEIKREVLLGELASRRSAALPIAAALGGMLVPAALYAAANGGGPGAAGWGVPMATDIAFALGILALLGDRIPVGLRVFLAALAIVDDLGAVLVIALFYTAALSWAALGGVAAVLAALVGLNAAGVKRAGAYVLFGVLLWLFLLASGVHATVAGVLLAMTVPARSREGADAPLQRMEHALNGPVAFLIVPLFALANAGVPLGNVSAAVHDPITRGVVLGLVLGKPAGIVFASWLAVRAGMAELPAGVSWRHVHGAGWLGGIGFTMSLFIASLAFGGGIRLEAAKLGILAASTTAGVVGYAILRSRRSRGQSR
jgi:NhaA family Na+:H+ antiporter